MRPMWTSGSGFTRASSTYRGRAFRSGKPPCARKSAAGHCGVAGARARHGLRCLGVPVGETDHPLSKDSCWNRNIKPKLAKAGLAWANFRVMRRTHSTLMGDLGVDGKLVADQCGHTLDVSRTSIGRRRWLLTATRGQRTGAKAAGDVNGVRLEYGFRLEVATR